MLPEHELEEIWFGETVIRTYWYSFQFTLGMLPCSDNVDSGWWSEDGHIEPERQQHEDDTDKPVRHCRKRYSIFIEPHLKSTKGYFQLRVTIHQFPMDLGLALGASGDTSIELSYTLKTSEEKIEIISFSDTVTFSDKTENSLILYVNVTLSC